MSEKQYEQFRFDGKSLWLVVTAYASWSLLIYLPFINILLPVLGMACICLSLRIALGHEWYCYTGLRLSGWQSLLALLALTILLPTFYWFLKFVANRHHISFSTQDLTPALVQGLLFTAIQTCSEEIMVGSLLLQMMKRTWPQLSSLLRSFLLALIFVGMHFIFYSLNPLHSGQSLAIAAAPGLLLVGILRNLLISDFNHIGFSWAMHFSWNATMFNGLFLRGGNEVSEWDKFNIFLGDRFFLSGAAIMLILYLVVRKVLKCQGPGKNA